MSNEKLENLETEIYKEQEKKLENLETGIEGEYKKLENLEMEI